MSSQLLDLRQHGQSVWYDDMSRRLLASGELLRMIHRDGLAGVTSNPTILEQAVNRTDAYDEEIALLARRGMSAPEIYARIVTADIAEAADVLHPVHEATAAGDGYVSLEVSPALADDAEATVAEALALWRLLDRDNAMIKVPGTAAGLVAVRRLIAAGVNVNVTLLFSLADYDGAARAYIDGIADRVAAGGDVGRIASVASVFVSRIDTAVDRLLDRIAGSARDPEVRRRAVALSGEAAVANAKLVYRRFSDVFGTPAWHELAARGARPQRPLWASTGTKNPRYSDVKYVETLVGPHTVTTLPPGAMAAFRDHGHARSVIADDVVGARRVIDELARLGVDLDAVLAALKAEGLRAFEDSFEALMLGVDTKRKAALLRGGFQVAGAGLGEALDRRNVQLQMDDYVERLWQKDPSLWSDEPDEQKRIAQRLGWLESPEIMARALPRLTRFAEAVRRDGIRDVVLLGMGGSSLAPEVMRAILGGRADVPALHVLDSTDPGAVLAVEGRTSAAATLFIVASKSGTTVEPNALAAYFRGRLEAAGVEAPARRFVAITDEGTPLHETAVGDGWREVFVNPSDIGGRYSALSFFGLVPAALLGVDVAGVLAWGRGMARLCGPGNAMAQNPGVALGILMGEAARNGRDKLTLIAGPRLAPFGLWVEQLIAESTGKHGTGIVPVANEPLGRPEAYGPDRLFVRLRVHGGDPDEHARDGTVERLRAAGHPIVTIHLDEAAGIGAEFVRWEIATATAGAILAINPFDEPNVQQAKDATRALLARYQAEGRLPAPAPAPTRADLAARFARVGPGAYVALLAYLPFDPLIDARLAQCRAIVRDCLGVATTAGYGPRYLHSTGQLHKGGADSGVFVVLTAAPRCDVAIPGEPYSFATLEMAQALGDIASLEAAGRRVVHLHLADPDHTTVDRACALIESALPDTHR